MQAESLLNKTQDFWKSLFPVLARLPKQYKYTLGDRAQNAASDILELVVEAFYSPAPAKRPLLLRANIRIETLRRYLRLGYELGCYPSTTFARLTEPLDEIGRMVGGWIKALS